MIWAANFFYLPANIYFFKVNNRNSEIDTETEIVTDVVLLFLLTLNIFQTFF